MIKRDMMHKRTSKKANVYRKTNTKPDLNMVNDIDVKKMDEG